MSDPIKAATDVTFRISPKALAAMRLLQSRDESRFAICGVHFEIHPDGKLILIATNGRYLGILNADAIVQGNVKELIEFTVDYPFVRYLPKPSGMEFEKILVHYDGSKVHFHSEGQSVMHDVIKGDFPKWRQCIPTTGFAPIAVSVNASYVTMFQKVASLLGGKGASQQVILKGHANGARPDRPDDPYPYSPYSVFLGGLGGITFYGVIMPMRGDDDWQIPDWLKLPEIQPAPVPKAPDFIIANYQTPVPTPTPEPAPIVAVAPGLPEVPHPVIPPHTVTTKAQARKERKHVHKRHPRPRKNLDRLRGNRHRKAR